ncbi:ATP-dependent RNA helicase HrpA [Neisseria gonorrhoeae]|nr:ATP-dependent RNA helicase HrpA [Neisseria gonorrhoeae]
MLFRRPEINGCKSNLFFKPPATAKSAAIRSLPRGGGPGRGHSPSCGNLSQQLNRPNTSLAACCPLSSPLPRGERTGRLLGLRFAARKTGCAGCFLFFRRPETTAANLSCLSNRLQPKNLPKPTPSPVGEGWGEGILRMVAIFPNTFAAQIQALRLVALSLALSHRERGRVGCWG